MSCIYVIEVLLPSFRVIFNGCLLLFPAICGDFFCECVGKTSSLVNALVSEIFLLDKMQQHYVTLPLLYDETLW